MNGSSTPSPTNTESQRVQHHRHSRRNLRVQVNTTSLEITTLAWNNVDDDTTEESTQSECSSSLASYVSESLLAIDWDDRDLSSCRHSEPEQEEPHVSHYPFTGGPNETFAWSDITPTHPRVEERPSFDTVTTKENETSSSESSRRTSLHDGSLQSVGFRERYPWVKLNTTQMSRSCKREDCIFHECLDTTAKPSYDSAFLGESDATVRHQETQIVRIVSLSSENLPQELPVDTTWKALPNGNDDLAIATPRSKYSTCISSAAPSSSMPTRTSTKAENDTALQSRCKEIICLDHSPMVSHGEYTASKHELSSLVPTIPPPKSVRTESVDRISKSDHLVTKNKQALDKNLLVSESRLPEDYAQEFVVDKVQSSKEDPRTVPPILPGLRKDSTCTEETIQRDDSFETKPKSSSFGKAQRPHRCKSAIYRRISPLVHAGIENSKKGNNETAIRCYRTAADILRRSATHSVGLARVLNLLGTAFTRTHQWDQALPCLHDALMLRYKHLGKWHVDTVDTLNNIGNVYMQSGEIKWARRCYWQVFCVRQAIFGWLHPSVAVSAHDLANAFREAHRYGKARKFYGISMKVYEELEVSKSNPSIKSLLGDIDRLRSLEVCRVLV